MTVALWGSAVVAFALASLRWLRVAQREHYLSWTVALFARRWWSTHWVNGGLLLIAFVGLVLFSIYPAAGLIAAIALVVGPIGLAVTGRTSPMRWTSRLRRVALAVAILTGLGVLGAYLLGSAVHGMLWAALLMPLLVDLALATNGPIELRLSDRFVDQAARTLAQVGPMVVGITGSYGKTSTKVYLARLLRDVRATVASPASFNNRLGLARSINEHLAVGTEVFIAEMGTYGKGEIADLCSWVNPTVGVITAIGPVHLERFGSLDAIVEAKAEILQGVRGAVINVDHPLLAAVAERCEAEVVRCSTQDSRADVFVDAESGGVLVHGSQIATLDDPSIFGGNLACAVGAALALGVSGGGLVSAIGDLPGAEHRQTVSTSDLGFTIIDDTYNSNPAGARSALGTLDRTAQGGRRALVTPGMVELGKGQHAENVALGALAAETATDIVIVGRTNRAALLEGTAGGRASVIVVDSREKAVDWVRANLGDGDVVLYENDLPDHYP